VGKNKKNLKLEKKSEKKSFGSEKKNFGSDTDIEIGPWFRLPIPIPGFGRTLIMRAASCSKT
jgi:hypothetical protein